MDIVNTLITWLSGALAALMVFVAAVLPHPAARVVVAPPPAPPAQTVATTTAAFPKATAKPVQKKAVAKPLPVSSAPVSVVPAAPAPATQTAPAKPQEQVNEETRGALVNILCLPQTGFHGISGSGVVVDSRGVILTNAHIGQYFLLRDYPTAGNVDCTIRTGSPAQNRYHAKLLYLPLAWIADNAAEFTAAQATGTGENDYAFLVITGTTDPAATLPASFPYLPMSKNYPDTGEEMLLASYPAGFLASELIEKSLYASSAVAYVTRLFSFDDNMQKVDLFSIGGTVLSQAGSSGGAVVRLGSGILAGIITTATVGDTTGVRDLRAVTLSHIDASLAFQDQGGVATLLSGDLSAKAADFASTIAPLERAALVKVLKGN